MTDQPLSVDAKRLLKNIKTGNVNALDSMASDALKSGFSELAAAGFDFEALALSSNDDEFFNWMLLYAPGTKIGADYAWRLFCHALVREFPAAGIARLLPLLRDNPRCWQSIALDLVRHYNRSDVASLMLPFCSDEDIDFAQVRDWLVENNTQPDDRAGRFPSPDKRNALAKRLLDAAAEGNASKLDVMLKSLTSVYRDLPHEPGETPAIRMMQAAMASKQFHAAELVFCHTDLLRTEWVECIIRHQPDFGAYLWMLEEPVFKGCQWEEWRYPDSGASFLHLAAEVGNSEFIHLWAGRTSDFEPLDDAGESPLMIALSHGNKGFASDLKLKMLCQQQNVCVVEEEPALIAALEEKPQLRSPVASEVEVAAFLERIAVFENQVTNRIRKTVAAAFDSRGYDRTLGEAVAPDVLEPLKTSFPLFTGLIESIQAQLSLLWRVAQATGKPQELRLPNTLIVGKPGWGKTYFIHRLGEVLGLPFRSLQMSTMSAGFILSGTDPTWGTSRPGMIHDLLAAGDVLNPLILLDEIDKIAVDSRHPADGSLFQLLEPEHARRFVDEFAAYPIDASHINWFASANELERAHPAIVSRFDVYEIPDPTPEVARMTALSVYGESLGCSPWAILFDELPDADVLDVMAATSPREAHRELKKAFGRASLAGRCSLKADDFSIARAQIRRIGFVG